MHQILDNDSIYEEEIQHVKKKFKKSQTRSLLGHKKRVRCLGWNSSGDSLASGAIDGTLRLWPNADRTKHPKDSLEMKGHSSCINALCSNLVNPDRLATTSSDKTVRLWDLRTAKSTSTIPLPGEGLNIVWSPDGNTIACGVQGTANMTTTDNGQKAKSALIHIDTRKNNITKKLVFFYLVNKMAWNPAGTHFFLITGSGEIEIRTWPEFKLLRTIRAHTDAIRTIDMNPNGKNFAVGSADSLASLWDVGELVCLRTFGQLNSMVHTISISYDGQYLAAGSKEDTFIDISHLETGENVFSVKTEVAINELAWNPKQLLLAYDHNMKENECVVNIFGYDR